MSSGISDSIPIYRDRNRSIADRVSDLLSRMTLVEKAGQLFHDMIVQGPDGSLSPAAPLYGIESTEELVIHKLMTHFNLVGPVTDARNTAKWHNNLQRYALEKTRLGIPITLSSDPRNHVADNVGTGSSAGVLSMWPETLGLAAIGDVGLVEEFANVARQEYLALGLRVALHPQIDLATEYRWARVGKTFGEDARLTGKLVRAYIKGFQGEAFGYDSVATMTKHFPGGGPQMNGEDPHFHYGKEQVYPGHKFEYHMEPFKDAISAGTRQIMPYYGMPVGTQYEEVGFSFNKDIISGLLREKLRFTGIICTDWGLVSEATILGQHMPARAWGCEHLTELQRVQKILEAGCDQFGGEARPELVIKLVEDGLVPETRINTSVTRILTEKFETGLFDNPFLDLETTTEIVGNKNFLQQGRRAQRKSYTLLTNKNNTLPLSHEVIKTKKIYLEGIDLHLARSRDLQLVSTAAEADIALLRLKCPYEPRPGGFEAQFHAGSLEYSTQEKERQASIFNTVPISVIDVYLDRPGAFPEVAEQASALMVSYGSADDAFLDVVFGTEGAEPMGKLPFDLPRSMDAVAKSREDVPFDTDNPVFRFGHGLRYGNADR